MNWITVWAKLGLSETFTISWTGAENDKCQECDVTRKEHDVKIQKHHFMEAL